MDTPPVHVVWQAIQAGHCRVRPVCTFSEVPYSRVDFGAACHSVFDLKAMLQSLTDVPPERQKILGLVKGKLPPDEERLFVHFP